MKKIIFSLLVLALVVPMPALALLQANSSATVVVGQQHLSYIPGSYNGGEANQGDVANGLYNPPSVYSDGTRLFIADYSNNRVLIYNEIPTSNNASADVVIGQPDLYANTPNNGGIGPNTLYHPNSVYATSSKLFIADYSNNRVLIYNSIPTENGASADVVIGQEDFTHNSANQGGSVGANTLGGSYNVYSDGTKLYITDGSNHRVLIYNEIPTSNNASADVVVGQANKTTNTRNYGGRSAKSLSYPTSVNTDGSKLIITDSGNDRVLIFNSIPSSDYAEANIVIGQTAMNLAVEGTTASNLAEPFSSFYDGEKLYITDGKNNRVLIFNSIPTENGASADVVVGQNDFVSKLDNQGGSVGANTLHLTPYWGQHNGVFSDGTRLFIADFYNNRVLVYNSIPTENGASADVVIGQADFTHNTGNQGIMGANTLNYPLSVSSDGTRLFIADASNNRVLVYNTIPTSNNASADVVIGQVDMTSGSANRGGSVGANTLWYPMAVYSDGTRLFIVDDQNHRVLIYNEIPTEDGASADVVIGQADMTSGSANRGGSVGDNTLKYPYGVFSDGTRLFIADEGNNRVLIYNEIPTEDGASADVVIGQEDLVTDNWPDEATANNIGEASGVTSDGTRLYVVDDAFNRILIYNTIPTENGASADVVIGQPDFTSNDINQNGSVGANTLNLDWWSLSLSVSNDKLFVADTYNSRVLIYPLGPQNSSASAPAQTSSQTIDLTLSASDDAKEMMISENPDFSGASWQSYAAGPSYTLADDSHEHNLLIKFRDYANYESAVHTTQVIYNKPATGGGMPAGAINPPTAPTAGSGFGVTIDNGENTVNTRDVTLHFQTGSDTTKVAIFEDPSFTGAPLLDYAPTMAYTLSEGNGPKTIYVKFYTQYGYASEPVSASITLNTQVSPTVQSPTPTPTPISSYVGRLIKYPDSPTVYLINQNNEKQPFYNALAFTEKGHQWSAIEAVKSGDTWPTGAMLYPSDYTEPATLIWNPPTGYQYISSPSQFPNYTKIISEPNSPRKYGLPKTATMSPPSDYHHGFTFSEYLSLGYNSPEVRNLQRVLKDLGYYQYSTATGYYGTLTESAVKQFQKDRQITPTGTVGPKTREVLNGMR